MEKKTYPFIAIKNSVVLPGEKVSLVLEASGALGPVNESFKNERQLILVFRKNGSESQIATRVKILQFGYITPFIAGIEVEGIERVRVSEVAAEQGIKKIQVESVGKKEESIEATALSRTVLEQLRRFIQLEGMLPIPVSHEIQKEGITAERASDIVASALNLSFPEKIKMLETLDVEKRLQILDEKLTREVSIARAQRKIHDEVEKKLGKEQREFMLREQLRAIEKELGIYKEQKEYEDMEKNIRASGMPKATEKIALKELNRLRGMPALSAEAPYIKTYLDLLIALPWSKKSQSKLDLKKAKGVLDEDHYGLEKVKERVLEFLAVQKLTNGKGRGTIMCFVGPPGTGKTSVGKSIARALNRKFARISLGGIRDEAEIRGHRRTYIGAMPGRIIQQIKTAETKNPVFMLDEIDKIGADFRGDPASALLEVLDPEQNNSFSDHYLEVPFDLSEVFFIATANILDTIPLPLRDRMEVIEFTGYTDEEKFRIAKKFLLPKILFLHGLKAGQMPIDDKAIAKIIGKHTREAGIRNLERKFSEVARKIVRKIAEGNFRKKTTITEKNLSEYIGPEEYKITMREAQDEVGIASGLAWTPAGGEIIFIEAAVIPGKGNLTLTGQLGEVMQESAKAALSYIRSRSEELDFNKNFLEKSDVHVHVPSGAVPKDGPSAGIAIATALASALTKRKIKKEVAMTGEITLSGKVLEIGGVKEKVLAARRAGAEMVILPEENKKNLTDIPTAVKKNMDFRFVKSADEVLKIALFEK